MIQLVKTQRTDARLLERMKIHYSHPNGMVGRSICYAIYFDKVHYGHIVAGSSTRYLPGRNEYLGITIANLNNVINNIFYSISPVNGKYPTRNFTTKVVEVFTKISSVDWKQKYGDTIVGFETLVEKPRTGELYRRAGWVEVGETKGYSCKRVSGVGTDSWGGRRIWEKNTLRPKLVLCYKLTNSSIEQLKSISVPVQSSLFYS